MDVAKVEVDRSSEPYVNQYKSRQRAAESIASSLQLGRFPVHNITAILVTDDSASIASSLAGWGAHTQQWKLCVVDVVGLWGPITIGWTKAQKLLDPGRDW